MTSVGASVERSSGVVVSRKSPTSDYERIEEDPEKQHLDHEEEEKDCGVAQEIRSSHQILYINNYISIDI